MSERSPYRNCYPSLCKNCGEVGKIKIEKPRRLAGHYCKDCALVIEVAG